LAAKWQEKPQLRVKLDSDVKARYSDGTDAEGPFCFAHIVVQNPPIPRVFRFLTYRQPARRVRLRLQYFTQGGSHPKFGFDARWSENLAPVRRLRVDGVERVEFDDYRIHLGRHLDIASGEHSEPVAVALKQEGDADCYGFTNESYEGSVGRRRPEYRLAPGTYRIVATATSGDVQSLACASSSSASTNAAGLTATPGCSEDSVVTSSSSSACAAASLVRAAHGAGIVWRVPTSVA
jgi:hypothetical protein